MLRWWKQMAWSALRCGRVGPGATTSTTTGLPPPPTSSSSAPTWRSSRSAPSVRDPGCLSRILTFVQSRIPGSKNINTSEGWKTICCPFVDLFCEWVSELLIDFLGQTYTCLRYIAYTTKLHILLRPPTYTVQTFSSSCLPLAWDMSKGGWDLPLANLGTPPPPTHHFEWLLPLPFSTVFKHILFPKLSNRSCLSFFSSFSNYYWDQLHTITFFVPTNFSKLEIIWFLKSQEKIWANFQKTCYPKNCH